MVVSDTLLGFLKLTTESDVLMYISSNKSTRSIIFYSMVALHMISWMYFRLIVTGHIVYVSVTVDAL